MKKALSLLLVSLLLISSFSVFASGTTMKDDKTMARAVIKDDNKMKSHYLNYSTWIVTKLTKEGKTVVLFFHADRCPTCVSLDKDIKNKLKNIPESVVIVKANYDTAKNLKKLYKVKSQNALVVVSKKGKIVARSKGATTTLKDLLALIK